VIGCPRVEEVAQGLLGEGKVDVAAGEAREGDEPDEASLEFADVRLHLARDEEGDVLGELHALRLGLLAQDRHLGLDVGGLDVGDEAPLEAAVQALLDRRDLRGGQSELTTICFWASWSALKMWKNSSCVRSFPAMNWMSSISSTSIERYFWRKDGGGRTGSR